MEQEDTTSARKVDSSRRAMSDDTSEYGREFCEAQQLVDEVEYLDIDKEKCTVEIKLQIAQVRATLAAAEALELIEGFLRSRK